MNNSVFGKTIENICKRVHVKGHVNPKIQVYPLICKKVF